jgi:general secretion pathway protein N
MRVTLPLGRRLFALVAFLLALVALFPLRLALDGLGADRLGLAARKAEGSIWLGRLVEAQANRVPLGDLTTRLNLLPLFVGTARVEFDGQTLDGALVQSLRTVGVTRITGDLPLGVTFAPLPLASAGFDRFTVRFRDGACEQAAGEARIALGGPLASVGTLAGPARCDGGRLLLPLASPSGRERIDLRIGADGRFRGDLSVTGADASVQGALAAAGFTLTPQGAALAVEGSL